MSRTVLKKFQKDISSRSRDIPLSNFGEEVCKQTDWQTYMKFRIIWNMCTNIPGMPRKNFRKISHTELEISLCLSNFSKKVSQLTDCQTYKQFVIIGKGCKNILGMSQKISGNSLIQNRIYIYICLIPVRK